MSSHCQDTYHPTPLNRNRQMMPTMPPRAQTTLQPLTHRRLWQQQPALPTPMLPRLPRPLSTSRHPARAASLPRVSPNANARPQSTGQVIRPEAQPAKETTSSSNSARAWVAKATPSASASESESAIGQSGMAATRAPPKPQRPRQEKRHRCRRQQAARCASATSSSTALKIATRKKRRAAATRKARTSS
ncbi:hypothetical protein BC567DRAFT_51108 [Phyllosticta citribraziliensis]